MPARTPSPDAHREALRVAFAAARSAATRRRDELLQLPNVIDVRAGYKFRDGWVTDTPAVVVTVLRKEPPDELGAGLLPPELDGIPTDVAPATPAEQLRHLAARGARAVLPPRAEAEPLLEPGDDPDAVAATARGSGGGREYQEPAHLKLTAVGGAMTLLCHVSPDAGWPTLQKFLAGTRKTLTVAMYDFGAEHIVKAIEGTLGTKGEFVLNLDRRSNPQRQGELTEEQMVARFAAALGGRFTPSTAAVGTLYPTAYHIKVAVRDGKAFWLSSGNWQRSNQPEADATALDEAEQRRLFSKHNREWHVVCENEKLAQIFEGFIQYDVAEAARVGSTRGVELPLPDLVLPVAAEVRAPARPVKVFKPKKFTFTAADRVKVQPILTPDNYGEHIVPLIRSAKKTLYFQNQYIKIPKDGQDGAGKPALRELTAALRDRVEAGVDVRIILRNGGDTREMLQALKVFGIGPENVRLLGGCHNKGIVVDSKAVLVSSQNYSADGVRFNRDAGLLIRHADVAAYFEKIFLHDWENRTSQRIAGESGEMPLVAEVAAERTAARGAAETISWDEFYGD